LKALYDRLESLIVGMVLAFPLLGTFMPIEIYLQPLTFQSVYSQQRVETYSFSHIVYLGIAALSVYLMLLYSRSIKRDVWRGALVLLLIALAFASEVWSVVPATTTRRALRLFEISVIAWYLFHKYDTKNLTRFMTRVLAIPVFASFAILVIRPDLAYSNLQGYQDAIRGAIVSKNALGGLMSVAVLFAGYSFFIRANNRIFAGTTLFGSLVLVVLSRSATSKIAVAATLGLALYGWIVRRRTNPGWAIMGAILTVTGMAALIFGVIYLEDLQKIIGRSSTLTGRTDVWRAVLEAIRHRPLLGYGYGFWDEQSTVRNNIWFELNWAPPEAHNAWLDARLQLGIVGLSITVMLWLVAFSRAIRLALFTSETGALLMALIIVNIFIRGLTETVMIDPDETDWLWFVIAYLHLARMAEARTQVRAAAVIVRRATLRALPW